MSDTPLSVTRRQYLPLMILSMVVYTHFLQKEIASVSCVEWCVVSDAPYPLCHCYWDQSSCSRGASV